MLKNWRSWPLVQPFVAQLWSRKFILMVAAILATEFGLDLSDQTQAIVYLVGASVLGITIAAEDVAAKRK